MVDIVSNSFMDLLFGYRDVHQVMFGAITRSRMEVSKYVLLCENNNFMNYESFIENIS